ncbi:TetR/AcrR family transcriptional regulator [Kribbella sp. NBC_00709]|uniref:TetR/AcrR family transcriptional regulator n=1 Tax=Kribbella sp. NBC_00709 TaxID=2975972 RepID=UPI002E2B9741|nr:TetR/AcrR family transcriptional regulator [Kribbella sp. NBC_00709]
MTDSRLVWERPEPSERQRPSPLSRERIVRAAIDLADAAGLDAVSLRKVAGALDAGPMRLYRYVDTKDELLELMVDTVYGEIPAPAGATWGDVLRSIATGIREAALRHEWFADLHGGRPRFGPAALAHTEASLTALRATGLDLGTMSSALDALSVYLVGAVRKEVTERRAERTSGLDRHQWQHATAPYIQRMFATGNYPALQEWVHDAPHRTAAEIFDLGLSYLIDGIQSRQRS